MLEHYEKLLHQIKILLSYYTADDNAKTIIGVAEKIGSAMLELQEPDPDDLETIRSFCAKYPGDKPFESIDDAILNFQWKEGLL